MRKDSWLTDVEKALGTKSTSERENSTSDSTSPPTSGGQTQAAVPPSTRRPGPAERAKEPVAPHHR